MIDFKTFESSSEDPKKSALSKPEFMNEPQGKLRRTASVRVWDKVGVGISGVDKRGVYCTDYIKKDEIFEVAPILIVPAAEIRGTAIMDYAFKVDDDSYAIAFGNSSIYNHRNQPSATWKIDVDQKLIYIAALHDIIPGEEIFISYGKPYWNTRDISAKTSPTLNK